MVKQLHKKWFICIFLILGAFQLNAQSFNHWTRSFNEESSLLSGAVVGGGAGPSSIYYNPASISEITESKLSFHASLFSFKFYDIKNALGDGIDLNRMIIQIEPRFASYMIRPKNHPDWDLEIAILNNENYQIDFTQSVDNRTDVLTHIPGEERYYAYFQYSNRYRDDWVGVGWSWKISSKLSVGASMFVTIKSMEYNLVKNIEAYPVDTSQVVNQIDGFYSANYLETEYLKYNDYRLLWKLGLLYKVRRFSVGLSFTSPSLGGIYSDGKRVSREQKQSNIHDPETGDPIPDYLIVDYQEKKNVKANHKTPFSVAAGFTWHSMHMKRSFYTTVEFFGGLDPYRLIEADESPDLATTNLQDNFKANEWLTFVSGAKPILNAAIGYSWVIAEDLRLLTGFRTDFNYVKDFNYNPYVADKAIKGLRVDNYHFTGGLSWNFKGQDLITGLQYTLGSERNQQQFINVSNPVEFNYDENAALQGNRKNNMNALTNSISLYVGASFNFGGEK